MDRMGVMPWALIQVLAMLGVVIFVSVALNLH
jgi:hypothetical protein